MEYDRVDPQRRHGRGADGDPAVRFDRLRREAQDDGWTPEDLPPLATDVALERARSILTRNASPDVPFDRSVNPYRGCEHGCVYCFARPSHAFLGLSPGLEFETRLVAKPNAPALLEQALRRKGYRVAPIAIGTNTDPYQPIEGAHRVMRGVLEVLRDFRHPVSIVTKGAALILRDRDILGPMGQAGLARVGLSLTTLDHRLSRAMEPRASAPHRRLAAITALRAAGCPVVAMIAPVIPGLNDHEIEGLVAAAAEAGAQAATYVTLRLPLEVAPLFRRWLEERFPDRASRVLRGVRALHGGRDYDPEFGKRMRGEGVEADLIRARFRAAARRHGLDRRPPPLRCDLFAPPLARDGQLALF